MSNLNATGLDDFSVKLLKITSNVIGKILTYLLNMSIKNSVVGSEWKNAKVTPSGDNFLVNNY